MITVYYIANDWDDKTLCSLDWAWINDGRETAIFSTEDKAKDALEYHLDRNKEDAGRLGIESYMFEPEQ